MADFCPEFLSEILADRCVNFQGQWKRVKYVEELAYHPQCNGPAR
jgi:hypothetical protein